MKKHIFYVSHSGISMKFELGKYVPLKSLIVRFSIWLIDHMTYVYTYKTDNEGNGTSADVENIVWRKNITFETTLHSTNNSLEEK